MGGDGGGLGGGETAVGCAVSLPLQPMMESGLYTHTALHDPTQSEHTCCPVTAQYAPNVGSVKPPDEGHDQSALLPVLSCTGAVLQMVAASFQALHAALSPVL